MIIIETIQKRSSFRTFSDETLREEHIAHIKTETCINNIERDN